MTIDHLDENNIIDRKQTKTPPNKSVSGYGSKLPTSWMLRLSLSEEKRYSSGLHSFSLMTETRRWHRVYVICYGNAGSAYVLVMGKRKYLSDTLL